MHSEVIVKIPPCDYDGVIERCCWGKDISFLCSWKPKNIYLSIYLFAHLLADGGRYCSNVWYLILELKRDTIFLKSQRYKYKTKSYTIWLGRFKEWNRSFKKETLQSYWIGINKWLHVPEECVYVNWVINLSKLPGMHVDSWDKKYEWKEKYRE